MWLHVPGVSSPSVQVSEDLISECMRRWEEMREQLPWSNGKPTTPASLKRALRKGGYATRLSGIMLSPLTLNRGVEKWMRSLEATRVNPSLQPEKKQARKTRDGSGRILPASSKTCARNGASSRTSPTTSISASKKYGQTFKEWVSMWKPDSLRRLKLARATYAGDSSFSQGVKNAHGQVTTRPGIWPTATPRSQAELSGIEQRKLWPTPGANLAGNSPDQYLEQARKVEERGGHSQLQLAVAVKMWPTPTVCGNYNRKGSSASSGDGLATKVKMWTTPIAHDAHKGNAARVRRMGTKHGCSNLNDSVMMWPTPVAREAEESSKVHGDGSKTLTGEAGGSLAPGFCEYLQGLPTGWTALELLEMR